MMKHTFRPIWRSIGRLVVIILALIPAQAMIYTNAQIELPGKPAGSLENKQFSFELLSSVGIGVSEFGGNQAHDLWLLTGRVGMKVAEAFLDEAGFSGDLEVFTALVGGGQHRPESAYYVGANGGIRYTFELSPRWKPYIICQAGIAATDIGNPDLSGVFQFNEQGGVGVRYHVTPFKAVILETGLKHISNGGISKPNDGVNALVVSVGYYFKF